MKRNVAILFALLSPLLAGAQTISVDYLDGKVELRGANNSWQPALEGAKLGADSVLRLSGGALAELTSGGLRLHLGRDGTYQLSTVLNSAQKKPETNLGALAKNKVEKLLGTGSPSRVEVADLGARAAEKGGNQDLTWATDDESDLPPLSPLEAVNVLLAQPDYKAALTAVNAALKQDPGSPKGLILAKTRALAGLGLSAAAVKTLTSVRWVPGEPMYVEAALLLATQALETQDYDQVLAITSEALTRPPETEAAQQLTIAQALAWRGKGDQAKARDLLAAAAKLAPKTPSGVEAARLSTL
ncbi:MAG: hypothetical protein WCG80_14435 [Spirochaetales bacterium]